MKAIKIDIKQTILDLEPKPYYLFRKLDENIAAMIVSENNIPNDMIKMHTEEYKVFEFYNPYGKERRINYLIKVNDKDLIDCLVKIEEDILSQKILDASLQANEQGWRDCKSYIKKLHFWKRLFNKF